MGSPELGFFEDDCRRAGFTSPARHRGDGGASRETDSIFSTLRARRAGHGARVRARLATGGSPVDSPSGGERRRDRPREAVAKTPSVEITRFLFVMYADVRVYLHENP